MATDSMACPSCCNDRVMMYIKGFGNDQWLPVNVVNNRLPVSANAHGLKRYMSTFWTSQSVQLLLIQAFNHDAQPQREGKQPSHLPRKPACKVPSTTCVRHLRLGAR